MQRVQNSYPRESFGHDVCEDTARVARIHGIVAEVGCEEKNLRGGIDEDEDICERQMGGIPEKHPGSDAEISESVIGDVGENFIQRGF